MNRISNIGNLVRDIELRHTRNGQTVGESRIAINEGKNTVFYDLTVFGDEAERAAANLGKGREVGVDGRLAYDEWTHEGEKRSKLYVIANHLDYLRGKRQDTSEPELAAVGAGEEEANGE